MFYPITDIDEIMPDVLVQRIEEKQHIEHRNKIGDFTKKPSSFRNSDFMAMKNKDLENTPTRDISEFTKGNLPDSVVNHACISYSYKGGNLMLNGLDDSMKSNNGSWRP